VVSVRFFIIRQISTPYSRLENVCFDNSEPFVLTLGEWGCKKDWSWNQTSRPGSNLVLQLNLSRKWSKKFESLQKETANEYTGFHHPVSNSRSATLAWARMDMDFETDEVLIEEIQSDLFKDILSMHNDAKLEQKEKSKTFYNWGATIRTDEFLNFSEAFIKQFGKSWQEAMLAASVYFVFEELGCSKIYYHSFETGNQMKNLDSCKPPKSLYTDLPKKFCFESIDSAPEFLSKEKRIRRKLKKLDGGRWFCMAA